MSGGGRADLGILERTDRVWTSDCNDALDRVDIQYGAGTSSDALAVAPLRLPGLEPRARYRAELITPGRGPLGMAYEHPSWVDDGIELSGRMLATAGLPLPIMLPESARLIHVTAVEA